VYVNFVHLILSTRSASRDGEVRRTSAATGVILVGPCDVVLGLWASRRKEGPVVWITIVITFHCVQID